MSERLERRRIVIACDAACDIRIAVGEAAALAQRWNAELHGVFLEDENLFRLASLPFGRQVTLSPDASESLSVDNLEKVSAALSAGMRRALEEAAAQHGLEWSFAVLRDLPSVTALAEIEADVLVVEATTRPFSGSWRPPSAWSDLAENVPRTTLIRRRMQARARHETVLILLGQLVDRERVLAGGFAMARPEDRVTILVQAESPGDIDSVREIVRRSGPRPEQEVRVEMAANEPAALLRQIERADPAIIATDADGGGTLHARELLASTHCDVLLLR